MALIEFKNLPDTSTPLNAENLNNNFVDLNKQISNVKFYSCNSTSTVKISSANGYGIVLVTSAMFTCVVQLQGNSVAIHDIQGNHGEMTATMSNNVVTLSNLYNWDHYIFIGSDVIQNIE